MQCCIAANAPWPPPPKASDHSFVVAVSTKRRLCGIRLQILHKSHDDTVSLPLPLSRVVGLTKAEYDTKLMKQLELRLSEWKGGSADALLTTWAFLVIVVFVVVAFMIPSSSWLFQENPFWILIFMASQLCGFYALWRRIRYENQFLIHNMEHDMRRRWRGIRVTMKRVAHLPVVSSSSTNISSSGNYCFCIILQSRGDDDDNNDAATLALSENDDDDDDSEEGEKEQCPPGIVSV